MTDYWDGMYGADERKAMLDSVLDRELPDDKSDASLQAYLERCERSTKLWSSYDTSDAYQVRLIISEMVLMDAAVRAREQRPKGERPYDGKYDFTSLPRTTRLAIEAEMIDTGVAAIEKLSPRGVSDRVTAALVVLVKGGFNDLVPFLPLGLMIAADRAQDRRDERLGSTVIANPQAQAVGALVGTLSATLVNNTRPQHETRK